jgi:pentose-5-phosphate-3-epimerase
LTGVDVAGNNPAMKTIKTASVSLLVLVAMSFTPAFAGQPYMQSALAHLREARASLQRAIPNKGGHRERAIDLVNQAIAQVEAGIRYAR